MAGIVYILCAALSLCCSYLLFKGYSKNHFRLLFWSAIGFLGFGCNNVLLFVDAITADSMDLSITRTIPAVAGMVLLVYGLISDTV